MNTTRRRPAPGLKRRRRPLAVPGHAHPLVRFMVLEMIRQRVCIGDVFDRAGLSRHTYAKWRTQTMPKVSDLEACLNVLGFDLKAVKKREDTNRE